MQIKYLYPQYSLKLRHNLYQHITYIDWNYINNMTVLLVYVCDCLRLQTFLFSFSCFFGIFPKGCTTPFLPTIFHFNEKKKPVSALNLLIFEITLPPYLVCTLKKGCIIKRYLNSNSMIMCFSISYCNTANVKKVISKLEVGVGC